MAFCDETDVFNVARSGSIPSEARLCASVSTASNTLELDGHGFADETPLAFRGEPGGSLPAPLVAGATYYAIRISDARFQVSATPGGAPVDLTTEGSLVLVLRDRPVAAAIERASADIIQMLPAHVDPTPPYPTVLRTATATLAAYYLRAWSGRTADGDDLLALTERVQKMLDRWGRGVPMRGANAPAPANLAVAASAATHADPRGWAPRGGTLP